MSVLFLFGHRNWIWGNNLLIKSSKVGDLNADINGTSDLSGYFFINVLKVSLNLTHVFENRLRKDWFGSKYADLCGYYNWISLIRRKQMNRVILTSMIYSYISFFHQWNEFFFNHNLIVEKRNEWNMKKLSRKWRRENVK